MDLNRARATCQDDRGKGKGKTEVHFETEFHRLLWVDVDRDWLDGHFSFAALIGNLCLWGVRPGGRFAVARKPFLS